jgi:hypothetical protein
MSIFFYVLLSLAGREAFRKVEPVLSDFYHPLQSFRCWLVTLVRGTYSWLASAEKEKWSKGMYDVMLCYVMIMFYLIIVALMRQIWRPMSPYGLIHGYPSTNPHNVTSQKTVILSVTSVIISGLTVRNSDQSNSINIKVKIWYKYSTLHIWYTLTMLLWERNRFLFGIPLLVAECGKKILNSCDRFRQNRDFYFGPPTRVPIYLPKLPPTQMVFISCLSWIILKASIVWSWNIRIHQALIWGG